MMMRQAKYLVGIIAALLAILLPSPVQAQYFSVSPAEVNIGNLSPGEEAEFNFSIHNKDNISHIFMLTTYTPKESQRKPGKAEFPDDSWVSFPSQKVEVAASSEAKVKATISIPSDPKWAGKNWEVWLGVTPKSSDLLSVKLYVRLLVSTSEGVEGGSNIWLIAGIIAVLLLLGCGAYYSRRKTKPK